MDWCRGRGVVGGCTTFCIVLERIRPVDGLVPGEGGICGPLFPLSNILLLCIDLQVCLKSASSIDLLVNLYNISVSKEEHLTGEGSENFGVVYTICK